MDRSLQRAVGERWLLGFAGAQVSDDFLRLLEVYPPRGIILFRDNLPEGGDSLTPLRRRLESAAQQPLQIWLDEEGGWIQQLMGEAWPAPMAQAATGLQQVAACHRAMARQARELGVDVTCAPLADLDDGAQNPVIGTRSFGADPVAAGEAVAAAVEGIQAGGLHAVLKHFPGHGDSLEDSHLTLPRVPADRREALLPFRAGLAAGAGAVMTGHLRLDDDDERPATFRSDLLRDSLGKDLGFAGLVVTDALEMAGAAVLPLEDRAAAALAAGCHLLMLARWRPGAERLLTALGQALMDKRVSQRDLDEGESRWGRFLAAAPGAGLDEIGSLGSADEPAPELQAIRRRAIFRPGGGEAAPCWDGGKIDVEIGETGHWQGAEFLSALEGLPIRSLKSGDTLSADCFLWLGRQAPSAERLDELKTLKSQGREPAVLLCGPWAWSLALERRLATSDSSPPGIRLLLASAQR